MPDSVPGEPPTRDVDVVEVPDVHDTPAEVGGETPRRAVGASGSADEVGLERLRAALLRPSRGQVIVGVLLAVLGFAAITQVRTNNTDNTYAGYREQDLVNALSALSDTSQRAQGELSQLETSRRRLEQNRAAQSAALEAAQKQAEELSILAGWVPATGPGIRLTVTEGPRPVDVNTVLDTIEELRSAGAEAMQVNGKVRLVAQSAVEPAQGGLKIDGQLVTSPYVIDAIGDPHTLSGALELVDGPIAQFKDDAGATVQLQQRDSLDITAVRQPSTPQYAQPQ
ncbi:MAG TPA: DUF881 domain-containing protein [Nocardioides sp.]|jgi:uncharacterized protein YlxW (UPF0749 family)|nr:DUF881 domain-containing protein [Nocardioides sp.]